MANNNLEIKAKNKYLGRYRNNLYCIQRLMNKLSKANQKANAIHGQVISDMPRGGGLVKTQEDYILECIELKQRINSLKQKSKKLKQELYKLIDELEDRNQIEVLELYYIDGLTKDAIESELNYSKRHVERLYTEGINNIIIKDL